MPSIFVALKGDCGGQREIVRTGACYKVLNAGLSSWN